MKPSENCYKIIKDCESLRYYAYKCPAGVWTIGYGHTAGVKKDMQWSEHHADIVLASDVCKIANYLESLSLELNQNQLDALCSFVYNVGEGNFSSSTMLKKLKAKDYEGATAEFPRWNKIHSKADRTKMVALAGLTRRRELERELFSTKVAND